MRREVIPEYYEFIKVDTTRREAIPRQLFTSRAKLNDIYLFELQLTTLSDVHVSTGVRDAKEKGGEVEVTMEQYVSSFDGKPSIPGSSLKGVVSKNYLALSGSGMLTSELFGSSAHPAVSKVFFEDAKPTGSVEVKSVEVQRAWMPKRWERGSVKVYTSKTPPTGKYGLMQCLPQGITLSTTMRGVSLKELEVGGLLMSIGLNLKDNQVTTEAIKLGYGKPQGFGQLQLLPEKSKLTSIELKGLTKNMTSQGTLKEPAIISKYIKAFANEINRINPKRNLSQIFQKVFTKI